MENITTEKSSLNSDRMRINISAASKAELEGAGKGGHPVLTASFGQDGVTIEPAVASLEPYRVEVPKLGLKNAGALNAMLERYQKLGFGAPLYYEVRDIFNSALTRIAVLPHESGEYFAYTIARVWSVPAPAKETIWSAIVSAHEGGSFSLTTSGKYQGLKMPPDIRVDLQAEGTTKSNLLDEHRAFIKDFKKPVLPVPDADNVRLAAEYLHSLIAQFHVERGIFVPFTEKERRFVERSSIEGPHARHSDVLLAAHRAQTKKSSFVETLVILGVTLALFMFFQKASDDPWKTIGILVAVLLFHEAGHFVAMKLFGYNDVKMFFIPGFGAAVTGKPIAPAGWKAALVSLAGPLPGIALGLALGIAALLKNNTLYLEASVMLLVLNTFNLAPLLPFDGGRFLHAVVFSRSPVLDIVFQGLAVCMLVLAYIALDSFVFLFLTITMALSLPMTWRTAQIASEVRKTRSPDDPIEYSEDGLMEPRAAGEIIERLSKNNEEKLDRATLANLTTQVYERVTSQPPSALASIGLLSLYAGGCFFGLLFAIAMTIASQGDPNDLAGSLRNFGQMSVQQPHSELPLTHLETWNGPQFKSNTPHTTLIAPLNTPDAAKKQFDSMKLQVPPTASVRLFGSAVFVLLPAYDDTSRRKLFDELEKSAPKTFVQQHGEMTGMSFQFIAKDPVSAAALDESLSTYFALSWFNVPAPWDAGDTRDPATRLKHLQAQKTYAELRKGRLNSAAVEEQKAFYEKRQAAQRRGDTQLVKKLDQERMDQIAKQEQESLAAVRAAPYANQAVIDAHLETIKAEKLLEAENISEADQETYDKITAAINARLAELTGGSIRAMKEKAAPGTVGTRFGGVNREGLLFEIQYCSFHDLGHGAPAMVEWLKNQGCNYFKYNINNLNAMSNFEAEE